ncbi:MAG TPA: NYN domain-containing protein, partial [Paracoccaceae bacterium]|nr:NYN domain-containing protein [Paracoccaceae bacterium]
MTETGTAILVDGENISPTHAPRILGAAAALAPIRLARVYGHVPRINGWTTTAGFVPVHTTRAKDGADLVLAIEAVAQAHAPGITHLVIATSDGGLAPLVHHLRAAGRSVLLLGEAKTPEALRLAASR